MIAIVDYGLGNVGSIQNMLKRVGALSTITGDPEAILNARKLILPGVGSFDNGIREIQRRGLTKVLCEAVVGRGMPTLGICLGMQLMTNGSEEGALPGLGWIDAEVKKLKIPPGNQSLRIPHMGWNTVTICKESNIANAIGLESRFYFVHSYHVVCSSKADVLTSTTHGLSFTSAFQRNNILGVQFHPEKSHRYGVQLLSAWASS